jgi:hypothetical protein
MRPINLAAALALFLATATGCTSISTTHVKRDPFTCGWDTKHLRGVPVTVKVPTHLEVRVIETQYLFGRSPITIHGVPFATRRVEYAVREKDEIFTVDFVRPAAGTGSADISFDGQYFKTVNGNIDDRTLRDITAGIKNIFGTIGKLPGAKAPIALTGLKTVADVTDIKTIDSVIAVRLFDVNDPGMVELVHEFLQTYLTGCTPPCLGVPATSMPVGPPILVPAMPLAADHVSPGGGPELIPVHPTPVGR